MIPPCEAVTDDRMSSQGGEMGATSTLTVSDGQGSKYWRHYAAKYGRVGLFDEDPPLRAATPQPYVRMGVNTAQVSNAGLNRMENGDKRPRSQTPQPYDVNRINTHSTNDGHEMLYSNSKVYADNRNTKQGYHKIRSRTPQPYDKMVVNTDFTSGGYKGQNNVGHQPSNDNRNESESTSNRKDTECDVANSDDKDTESKNENDGNTEDILAKYLRKKVNRTQSRRSVSDLGFSVIMQNDNAIPTPRTAALLNNDVLRRHLANVMGVDQTSLSLNDFSWDFRLRTDSKLSDRPFSRNSKLRSSVSDGTLKDIKYPSTDSATSTDKDNMELGCITSKPPVPPSDHTHRRQLKTSKSVSSVTSSRTLSKLAIPSFEEFKQMRKSGAATPSTIFQTIVEDESETESKSSLRKSQSTGTIKQRTFSADGASSSHVDFQENNGGEQLQRVATGDEVLDVRNSRTEYTTENIDGELTGPTAQYSQFDLPSQSQQGICSSSNVTLPKEVETDVPTKAKLISADQKTQSAKMFKMKLKSAREECDHFKVDENFDNKTVHDLSKSFDFSSSETVNTKVRRRLKSDNDIDNGNLTNANKFYDVIESKPPRPHNAKGPVKAQHRVSDYENVVKNKRPHSLERPHSAQDSKSDLDRSYDKLHTGVTVSPSIQEVINQFENKGHSEAMRKPGHVMQSSSLDHISDFTQGQSKRRPPRSSKQGETLLLISKASKSLEALDDALHSDESLGNTRETLLNTTDSLLDSNESMYEPIQDQSLDAKSQNVTRSTSDVSDMQGEARRTRSTRDRRIKAYKSDPFSLTTHRTRNKQVKSGPVVLGQDQQQKLDAARKSICSESATRDDIIEILTQVKEIVPQGLRSRVPSQTSLDSSFDDDFSSDIFGNFTRSASVQSFCKGKLRKGCDSCSDVERVDSGVGAELRPRIQCLVCEDCEADIDDEDVTLCQRCKSRRLERQEAIQELVNTEVSYGKDLHVIKQEFLQPMKTAGLLTSEQICSVFSNLDELISISLQFAATLQDALASAQDNYDYSFYTVCMGQLFLEASNMLLAFETYCVAHSAAIAVLEQLEKEKDLLRVFLQVSQTENSLLRRMNLRSFLMVPVQRIMKYPLLLSRIYKATPHHHDDKQSLKQAQTKVEDILEHINKKTKDGSFNLRVKRKISELRRSFTNLSAPQVQEDLEVQKAGIEILGWHKNDVHVELTGRLMFTQPTDCMWMKKPKALKFSQAYALLVTLKAQRNQPNDDLTRSQDFPRSFDLSKSMDVSKPQELNKNAEVEEAALVLLKYKNGKLVAIRAPLKLQHCVVSVDSDYSEVFEVMDISKEVFLLKSENVADTLNWLSHVRHQARRLGKWRRRRGALPNIMINNVDRQSVQE